MWLKELVALLMLVTVSLAAIHKRPFRSIKAPIETIENYDVVVPTITYTDSNETYPKVLHISLTTSVESFLLVLEQNKLLISKNFVSRHYDDSGRETLTKGHDNCYYQGFVENQPDWIVTMTTCHGLQGEFGDPSNKEDSLYHIEPLDNQDRSLSQIHALYLDSEYKVKEGGCGSDHNSSDGHHGMDLPNLKDVEHNIQRRQTSGGTRFVELVIVNDFRQYTSFNRNLGSTVQRALSIANRVDTLYRTLGIRVILIESITWTSGDRITISGDPETLLNNFRGYRRQITTVHDAAILLTGNDFNGNTVGIAFTGTMCSDRSAVGVSQDGGRGLTSTSSITAHELGHIFNMPHDGQSCSCNDPSGQCIMTAISGFPVPSRWSSCSVDSLNRGFTTLGLDRCLFNTPSTTVGDPVCGNGIREGNEVCDCGSPQECTDPCCNARTCRLATGAACSAGECCTSTCRFRAYGTTCRASNGECDIAEYCSGESNECPTDEHKVDRTPCNNNGGYCYSGSCPTHNEQCSLAFGSRKGNINCYSQGNTRGDQFGNCGSTSTNFIRCAQADVQCGQLQCTDGEFQAPVNTFVTILNLGVFDRSTRRVETCRSFTTSPGADAMSPGLVLDGTKCGNGQVCDAQRCVAATITNQCDSGSNGQICSGNGICNNRGSCSCNIGFTGTVCQTPTNGGDVNECNSNNGGCDQVCTNTDGSFRCSCRTGYTLATNGRTCNDVNECSSNNGGCSQICVNTAGSFRCSCRTGFTLQVDGRSCTADTVIPPTPIDVEAFCSAVVWRTSLSSCDDTVTSYQVQFYIPGTSQTVTRTISSSSIFHYVIQDQDTFNIPENTLIRVRARNSAGVSAWSSGVTLGCREECAPSPTPPLSTPPPTLPPTQPPSVQFSLKGRTYSNNSVIPFTEIGEGDDALLCITDKEGCCNVLPNRFGDFYYPNGNKVPNRAAGEGFFRGRGPQLVRLSRRSSTTSPRGVFRCDIPDKDGVPQKIYIRLS